MLFCIAEPIPPAPWKSSKFLVVAEMMHRSVLNICFRNWFGKNPTCSFPFRQCCPGCLTWLTEIVYLFWKCSSADFLLMKFLLPTGKLGSERREGINFCWLNYITFFCRIAVGFLKKIFMLATDILLANPKELHFKRI